MPDQVWNLEVTLRGSTFGTAEQARATAGRWHQLVGQGTYGVIELVDVAVRDPQTGRRDDDCTAVVRHGPGHQSRTRCEKHGAHELHEAFLNVVGDTVFWRGTEGCTGSMDESPLDEDDPYTHVESRGYFVVCCVACDGGTPLPLPFKTVQERVDWVTAHRQSGHEDFVYVDPPEGTQPAVARWVGTLAFEGIDTTDGRRLRGLLWSRLETGPLPVVLDGTGEPAGTVTEVWRESLGDGSARIRGRGTVLSHVVGPSGRVALGVDVVGGTSAPSGGGTILLQDGQLLGLTLYPDGSNQHSAWPECALKLVSDDE